MTVPILMCFDSARRRCSLTLRDLFCCADAELPLQALRNVAQPQLRAWRDADGGGRWLAIRTEPVFEPRPKAAAGPRRRLFFELLQLNRRGQPKRRGGESVNLQLLAFDGQPVRDSKQ